MTSWTAPPTHGLAPMQDAMLTRGVLLRRCTGWLVDLALIGCLLSVAWFAMLALSVVTLGLATPLFGLLPMVAFAYHFLFVWGFGATPGQALFGLRVVRNDDLGPPELLQALLSTLVYWLTLATSGLLLLAVLFTGRKRTLHDLAGGLVVVRARALTPLAGSWNMAGGSPYA